MKDQFIDVSSKVTSLLVIGDKKIHQYKFSPSFNSFIKRIERIKRKGLELEIISYRDVLSNQLPEFSSSTLTIMLFFPYKYWNKNIEVYKKDSRIYGDKEFGKKYKRFFERVEKIIEKKYRDKKIKYVNPPKSSVLERDKKASKKLFQKKNIPAPKIFNVKKIRGIQWLIGKGIPLYIKPRFGGMGKGITYLSKEVMSSNFLFRKGKIISRLYDYNWEFSNIKEKNRNKFLKILLSRDFIFEQAIDPPIVKGRRYDFRVYCIYGEIVYYYVKSMPAISPVTNWSQGGRIEKRIDFSRYVPKDKIKKVKSLARRVAKELDLNYTGIDIIFSKDFKIAYVLEAHSFPGFEKGFDLMGCLARRVLKN